MPYDYVSVRFNSTSRRHPELTRQKFEIKSRLLAKRIVDNELLVELLFYFLGWSSGTPTTNILLGRKESIQISLSKVDGLNNRWFSSATTPKIIRFSWFDSFRQFGSIWIRFGIFDLFQGS